MIRSLFVLLLVAASLFRGHAENRLAISQWLSIEPHTVEMPTFHQQPNTRGNTFELRNLLDFNHIQFQNHFPAPAKVLTHINGRDLTWNAVFTDANGYVFLEQETSDPDIKVAYLAVYIQADRYIHTNLEIKSPHMLRVWLNGEPIGTKGTTEQEENTVGKVNRDLKLERGKHLLLIKTLRPAQAALDWKVMASLEVKAPWQIEDLSISTEPLTRKNISHILDGVKITSIEPSHDGKYYSVNFSRAQPPSDQAERWTEIRRADDRRLMHSFRHARITQGQWLPNSNRFSFVNTSGGKSSLFVLDLDNSQIITMLEEMENFSGYRWAPNEEFIIYTLREEGSRTDTDIRQVLGMQDRQAHFRHRSFLYRFHIASATHQRLTFGNLTTSLQDISPDSRQILFSQSFPDYTQRPFSRQNMFILHLADMRLDTLWMDELRGVSASFSPDGRFLLATGGPSAFGGIGENVPEGMIPNNYDTQAYIYEIASGKVNPITRNFNPDIASARWHKPDNMIYLLTTDEDYRRLYRYDVRRDRIEFLDLGWDYISSVSLAPNARWAIISASQTNAPSRHFMLNLRNQRSTVLEDTESEIYRHVEFGQVKNWEFASSSNTPIKGRVYYPPDFDPAAKYPVIIYYYAGTTPVGRTFGGRYPFNLWAGNGYLVYVFQPSGATGFGQEFSAAHVNNWGITVADEIIEGTQKFLEAHPYADASRVGCAGASYGGFMTMLLMTRTDMFTAAISHAGISSISSYWGEGFWGYAYSAEASADSYPWNNRELYVEQSPLFHADKINTPLLLITGDSDTNVPPGESIQLYTALKILDRPVELVMVKGEDHHIVTYSKRKQWHNVIMAWWDKHLKDQPQWWTEQFPEKNY